MWIVQLAWKNIWRNKSRTAITMAAVSFATVISMLAASLKEGIFNNLIKIHCQQLYRACSTAPERLSG